MRNKADNASCGCKLSTCDIPGSFVWILSTVLAAIAAVVASGVHAPAIPKSASLPAQVETRISTTGHDKNGRSLSFTVYVLTDQLSWKLESTEDLEGGNKLLSPELVAAVSHARDVFCVGTASFEGGTQAEEARAEQRSGELARWMGTAVGSSSRIRVYALNAGQYKGPRDLVSSSQRKAIILVTGPHDDKVDLGEGLKSGLERQQASPVIYSLLHHYSRSHEWLRGFAGSR